MTATTYSEFNHQTEASEVAAAFSRVIRGKTILITGVSRDGIGFTTAQAFASQSPIRLIIASRSSSKIQQCIDELNIEFPNVDYRALVLDLSSQQAVREAAKEVLSWTDVPRIDAIINNAAVMNLPDRVLSVEGIEVQFATNHVGHFLFTNLIMPKLMKAAEFNSKGSTRVINVTSLSPTVASMRWSDINFDKINKTLPEAEQPPYAMHKQWGFIDPEEASYLPLEGYNQSKVANVLFGIALNKRLYNQYGILSLACHPGIIRSTELSRYSAPETLKAVDELLKSGVFYVKNAGQGAATTVLTALDPKLGLPLSSREDGKENVGAYFIDCQISDQATSGASSSAEAEKLWTLSEKLVNEKFSW